MSTTQRKPLETYLSLEYPFEVRVDPDGGYVVAFPDLPGCMTQVESLDEVGPMAEEIRTLWIETAYDQGLEIPTPSCREAYSGKFNVRLPRSLHRFLAESAEREGVSLNQYVLMLLSQRDAEARIASRLAALEAQLEAIHVGNRSRSAA
ncbi:MAG TPA: toxin-antitoxin system HicB family antitoxin [Nitrolancea sp.]|nr:toxin-antitoxin system HicB family antitoxin [Nitrolancea sp.]